MSVALLTAKLAVAQAQPVKNSSLQRMVRVLPYITHSLAISN